MSELLLSNETGPVLRCPLISQVVSVGQSAANDISIPDPKMPPLFCSFEPTSTGYRVIDRSGQGLNIGGKKVSEHELTDGDEVSLGPLVAKYSASQSKQESTKLQERTGILQSKDGELSLVDLQLQCPQSVGGQSVDITPAGLRVGANDSNDVVVDDGFISGFHAQLYLKGNRLFVRDLDSTNGSFLGGVRIMEAEVPLGASLRLGQTEFTVGSKSVPYAPEALSGKGPWKLGEMVTADLAFSKMFSLIKKVAPHDASVCILGETGTGKELAANAMHAYSARSEGPLVALNCAAIPEGLIESELFGNEKGAFTGADKARAGAFEQANGGTLFLDEVGELPLEMQAKLLRVLEVHKVRRLGANKDTKIDVRIVAATHRNLVEHVQDGKFREDLLHRLWVIPVHLSPLRERPKDIIHLATFFAQHLNPEQKKVPLTKDAQEMLLSHPFPGNVRELRNVIQRALILRTGAEIDDADIQFIPVSIDEIAQMGSAYRRGMTMEEIEREAFEGALACYPSAAQAARSLGMAKSTFWRRAQVLGILGQKKEK